jgi:Zn-dependent peptidase ImmA (M78 family)
MVWTISFWRTTGYRIVVNQDYPVEEQRVAAAHELSHYMKDRDRFTDRLRDDRMYKSGLQTTVEEEADKVALYWLIPARVHDEARSVSRGKRLCVQGLWRHHRDGQHALIRIQQHRM